MNTIVLNSCIFHYQVSLTSSHQYVEALKNHLTVHEDISTELLTFFKSIGIRISLL